MRQINVTFRIASTYTNHSPKARPTAYPRSLLRYGLPAGNGFILRVKRCCYWGGLNSRPCHYQSKGSTAGSPVIPSVLSDCNCVFAVDPHQTQTVRSCGFGVFLLKVLWFNKIGKSDLRRTYGPTRTVTCTLQHRPINSHQLGRSIRRIFPFVDRHTVYLQMATHCTAAGCPRSFHQLLCSFPSAFQ